MGAGLLAALGFAGGILLNKFELSKRRLPMSQFMPWLFVALCGGTGLLILLSPTLHWVRPEAMSVRYLLAFVIMIALAVAWNMYYYAALAKESIQEFDLITLTEPIIIIGLASIFFSTERDPIIVLLGLIAGLALVVAHFHKHHIQFDRYSHGLFIALFLMALEVQVIRVLLEAYSPVALYFWRTFFVAVVFMCLYQPFGQGKFRWADVRFIILGAVFGILEMVARYTGYSSGGIVLTTLLVLVGPVAVELYGVFVLHEKVQRRTATAFVVILACVLVASVRQSLMH